MKPEIVPTKQNLTTVMQRRASSNAAIDKGVTLGRRVSIVIPALDEAQSIRKVINSIPTAELRLMGYDAEIIVVDNGSVDGTGDAAREEGATVVLEPRRGYGRACRTGYARASGEIIVSLDADLTYPAELIPELIRRMDREDYDFITTDRLTSLTDGAMTRLNRLGNTLLGLVARSLFHIPVQDLQSGMWLIRRTLADRLSFECEGMSFTNEIKIRALAMCRRWVEVPIEYRRRLGVSKLKPLRDGWGMLSTVMRLGLAWQTGRIRLN